MPPRSTIEAAWGVVLPAEFAQLHDRSDWNAVQLITGGVLDLPWSVLSPQQIVALAATRTDWQIPANVIPFMGDLHDLLCLDYRQGGEPAVVLLNDHRESTLLFPSLAQFIQARVLRREVPRHLSSIIEQESWLDF